jgi:hypothetical protein
VLHVFGDESADAKEERAYAVAGVIGRQEEWDSLDVLWKERTGGMPFHSSDCEAGRRAYEGISNIKRMSLYRDLVRLLASSRLMGFAVAIDLQGFQTYFEDSFSTVPYELGFRRVVMHFAELAYKMVPRETVDFTFDLNNRTNPSTAALYEWIITVPEWEYKYAPSLAPDIRFAAREKYVGLQAADMWAREGMKHFDNFFIGPRKYRFERQSSQKLRATNRFSYEFLTREFFENWRSKSEELEKITGITRDDYAKWLARSKLVDNPVNRARYLMYFDSLKKA